MKIDLKIKYAKFIFSQSKSKIVQVISDLFCCCLFFVYLCVNMTVCADELTYTACLGSWTVHVDFNVQGCTKLFQSVQI